MAVEQGGWSLNLADSPGPLKERNFRASAPDSVHEMKTKKIKGAASTKQIKAKSKSKASTKQIKAKASASTEKNQLGHDKAATGGGDGQKQPEILRTLDPEFFPPLVSSNLDLYRPYEEMEGYVILPGEEGDEVIYYGEEE